VNGPTSRGGVGKGISAEERQIKTVVPSEKGFVGRGEKKQAGGASVDNNTYRGAATISKIIAQGERGKTRNRNS